MFEMFQMFLYAYCGNSPLTWLDPFGLDKVAFYASEYEEYADDVYFDHKFEVKDFGDVIAGLLDLHSDGVEITDIYFFDHCINWDDEVGDGGSHRVYGLSFGSTRLRFDTDYDADNSLEKYMRLLGHLQGENGPLTSYATIHFRNCYVGERKNYDRIADLIEWTGGSVTAVNGVIRAINYDRDTGATIEQVYVHPTNGVTIDLPDYNSANGYVIASPYVGGGILIAPYNERTDIPYYVGLPRTPY